MVIDEKVNKQIKMLDLKLIDFALMLACIAGGIVGARNKILAAEPRIYIASGEAARNTACQRTWVF